MKDIEKKILAYYKHLQLDENHRYKSWEHCFKYFDQKNIDEKIACLHMSFFLASWGMYRGSSFLLSKDYLVHREVVKHLLSLQHLRNIDFSKQCTAEIAEIFELSSWIRNWYQDPHHIKHVNGEAKKIHATDTLVTKILLGTLGCIPAYDTFFKNGLKTTKGLIKPTLSQVDFQSVVKFYNDNKDDFDSVQVSIKSKSRIDYPAMKLVDMYFWQIGFEEYSKSRKSRSLLP